MDSPTQSLHIRRRATKELALFTGFLFFGLVIMPMAIYFVGESVFGNYGGAGYGDFFDTLSSKVRSGEMVAWFLILSPYTGWQILRILTFLWRRSGPSQPAT